MKKLIYIAASLFLTMTMQAQDRSMPKAGPAPKININKPVTFTLDNGLKVLVVENNKLPRVSYSLTLDNAPYVEGDKKGVSDLLSAMIGNGTKTISKEKFNEEIDFLGANVNIYSSGAFASGLSKYSGRILELMADGTLNSVFTKEDFEAEKAKILENIKNSEKNVPAIAARVENALVFGKNHYNGEFTTVESINKVTLDDVINNYNTYFVPGNAYLVVVGDVKTKEVKKKIEQLFDGDVWKKAIAPNLSYSTPKDLSIPKINFVDMPNAVQSEISVTNVSTLKMSDKDFFAALLADQILGGGGEGRLFLNLREKHGWTYGSYSNLGDSKYVSKFRASASVRNAVTDSAVVEILNEIKRIRTELVSDEDLKNAKAKYVGNFVMEIQKPQTIARYALNIETEKLPADFYENYIQNLNAVTAEDLKAAANKYFKLDNIRIVVVGKAADVLPGLEALAAREKMPIEYFDKYANPTEKPTVKKPIPAGVTAQSVLKNYIDAIGGEKKLNEVKTLLIESKAAVQGQEIVMVRKITNKKQFFSEISLPAMGMIMSKQLITEKKGYSEQQGNAKDYTPEELKTKLERAVTFEELNLIKNKDIKLEGIENINGKDVYVILNGKKKLFYDTKDFLKLAEDTEQEGGRMMMINYTNYVEVKGIKFPYTMALDAGMPLEFITNSVKINEGVTDKDFE